MTQVVKVLANTEVLGAANTDVGRHKLVRILNTANTVALITVSDTVANSTIGTYALAPLEDVVIIKEFDYVVSSNNAATVLAVPIAFTY
jgi:hypothetical protein